MPSRKVVKVTVKSDLRELEGKLKIDHQPVDAKVTWEDFLAYYKVPFDKQQHVLKTSKNTAFIEDFIQETASFYARGCILVKIVRSSGLRRIPGIPAPIRLGAAPAPKARAQAHDGTVLAKKRGPPLTKKHGTSSPLAKKLRVEAAPALIPKVAAAASATPTTSREVHSFGNSTNPNRAVGRANLGPYQFEEAVDDDHGQLDMDLLEQSITGNRPLPKNNYAESACSQESQPPDKGYSQKKQAFMLAASRMRNADFDQFYDEMEAVKKLDIQRRFRWQSKIPLFAGFLFGWIDEYQHMPRLTSCDEEEDHIEFRVQG